jgi:hypothetical protein
MSFTSLGGYLTNIETYIKTVPNGDYVPNNFEGIKYNSVITDTAGGWSPYIYNAPGNFQNQVQLTGSVYYYNDNGTTITGITTKLYKNGTILSSDTRNINANSNALVQLKTTTTYSAGDQFYVTYECTDTAGKRNDLHIVNGTSPTDTYFIITAGAGNIAPVVTSSYWTSSFQGNVLTSSTALSYYYGPGYSQTPVVTNGTGSGFKDPISFTIQPYDQIRFGGNENQVYTIMSSSLSGSLFLHLDRAPDGQNLDYFSIKRLVDDPGFIILDNNPTQQPGTAPAFIIPKYLSPTLKDNLSGIIADLSSKRLLL